MAGRRKDTQGNAILEFTLTSIPLMFVLMSIVQMALAMWNYHTLAEVIKFTTRMASVRGTDCAGLACQLTVAEIAQTITTKGIGLTAANLNVTLTSNSGSISCAPVTNCSSNNTAWPPSGGNQVNQVISISATYSLNQGLAMLVPGKGSMLFSPVTFSTISQQVIGF
ncbi:MAG: TadE family protein [Bryobacteraceae bacterium]|jgi:Flp pilus assembly protein TadG